MNNLSLDSHLVFIKDQIEWCEGAVIDRDENDNPICVRNYCNLDTAKYWLDMFIELEKDLGCPLEVVFKAIVDGIVIIGDRNEYADMTLWLDTKPTTALIGEKRDFEEPRLIKYNEWCFSCNSGSYSGCVKLKDYKKTWWLSKTKEE